MPATGSALPLRVVIDTNVVLSALLFNGPTLQRLREHWQSGTIVPVIARETVQELIDVLRYPKFKLDAHEQNDVLAAYLPYCAVWTTKPEIKPRRRPLPTCRDPHDQIYLLLAATAGATHLVTGDKDLLTLYGKVAFEIVTAAQMVAVIDGQARKPV